MTLKAKTDGDKPAARGRSTLKLYFKSDPARDYLDFHIILREITTVSGIGDMIGFSCHLLEQTNRGKLTLAEQRIPPNCRSSIRACSNIRRIFTP